MTGTGASDGGNVYRLADMHFEGPNLDLPSPPADLPYARFEDWRAVTLLAINGIPATQEGLLEALRTRSDVLLAAAAHTSGSDGIRAAVPELLRVAEGPDDYAAVEAAYALARIGDPRGEPLLREGLGRPVSAYLSPVLAAGCLARLGNPAGYPVVRAALASEMLATKMLACKQLAFFLPLHGVAIDDRGAAVDALGLFEQALADPDPAIQRQALAQLESLRPAEARHVLQGYMERAGDPYLRDLAAAIIEGLPPA